MSSRKLSMWVSPAADKAKASSSRPARSTPEMAGGVLAVAGAAAAAARLFHRDTG